MKILVCDQVSFSKRCKKLLERFANKYSVHVDVEQFVSGKQLLDYIEDTHVKVDLLILEYDLPDITGLEVAQIIRKKNKMTDIVFYTADEDHIIDGYEVDALYYAIKYKTSEEVMERIFLKAVRRLKNLDVETVSFTSAKEERRIKLRSIKYFEIHKRVITVHYDENDRFEFYSTISSLQESLEEKGFVRIHQAYLVSLSHIAKKSTQAIRLFDGTVLPIGRSYQKKLAENPLF